MTEGISTKKYFSTRIEDTKAIKFSCTDVVTSPSGGSEGLADILGMSETDFKFQGMTKTWVGLRGVWEPLLQASVVPSGKGLKSLSLLKCRLKSTAL